jgi:hypothetical protein
MSVDHPLDNQQSNRTAGPPKTWDIETETDDDGSQHLVSVENAAGDVAALVYVRDDADLGHLEAVLHDVESEVRHLTRDGSGGGDR